MDPSSSDPMVTHVSVMKFGGSSFAEMVGFASVCEWLAAQLGTRGSAHRIVCVVSAPTGATERHREALLSLNTAPSDRLIDAALPLADSLGAAQVAAALQARGVRATVALGSQIGLRTDTRYTRARLQSVDTAPLRKLLATHEVVVVPGGQSSATATHETTWLGKNSSDLSAVALAAAFGCSDVEIYSDVPGVYSSDPNLVTDAHLLERLSHRQAIEMSTSGAKVLHHSAVQHALAHGMAIVCRRNRGAFEPGTRLEPNAPHHAAVVPDARSQVYSGPVDLVEAAARRLEAAGLTSLVLPDPDAALRRLAVTCGFFDADLFLARERSLGLRAQPLRLLTVLTRDGQTLRQLVPPEALNAEAQNQHARHVSTKVVAVGAAGLTHV